jgi:hypothetical protein
MLWKTSSASYLELLTKPAAKVDRVAPTNLNDRREAFEKIVDDIAVKMVQDFRDENKRNYQFLKVVNFVTIGIGIVLLISSLVIGVINDRPDFAAVIGGVAIADFVAIFLVNPQSRITGLLKDFAQYELIFSRWSILLKAAFAQLLVSDWSETALEKFQNAFDAYTATAIKDIESYIAKE